MAAVIINHVHKYINKCCKGKKASGPVSIYDMTQSGPADSTQRAFPLDQNWLENEIPSAGWI